ncbi:carboxymuconolactone decarboxylase family protein [Pikeienuella sp. HZG-20]|uniref:carboxymuconolactone decarboxylase family protein n=1 Tax=Paludibacillus litoralis TaxID=3133267 RepID=UPI0030EE357F
MKSRMDLAELAPDLYQAVVSLDRAVRKSGIDARLLHLVKIRASQINGCAFCLDMHVKESLADGLDPQMLHLVAAWRDSSFFDERDRAALMWTESVTLVAQTGIPDADHDAVRAVFSDAEIAQLTFAISGINVWNRLMVSARRPHPVS